MAAGTRYKKKYKNNGRLWTEEEREEIMTSEKSDIELSEELGRSVSAITNQRYLIYKEMEEK